MLSGGMAIAANRDSISQNKTSAEGLFGAITSGASSALSGTKDVLSGLYTTGTSALGKADEYVASKAASWDTIIDKGVTFLEANPTLETVAQTVVAHEGNAFEASVPALALYSIGKEAASNVASGTEPAISSNRADALNAYASFGEGMYDDISQNAATRGTELAAWYAGGALVGAASKSGLLSSVASKAASPLFSVGSKVAEVVPSPVKTAAAKAGSAAISSYRTGLEALGASKYASASIPKLTTDAALAGTTALFGVVGVADAAEYINAPVTTYDTQISYSTDDDGNWVRSEDTTSGTREASLNEKAYRAGEYISQQLPMLIGTTAGFSAGQSDLFPRVESLRLTSLESSGASSVVKDINYGKSLVIGDTPILSVSEGKIGVGSLPASSELLASLEKPVAAYTKAETSAFKATVDANLPKLESDYFSSGYDIASQVYKTNEPIFTPTEFKVLSKNIPDEAKPYVESAIKSYEGDLDVFGSVTQKQQMGSYMTREPKDIEILADNPETFLSSLESELAGTNIEYTIKNRGTEAPKVYFGEEKGIELFSYETPSVATVASEYKAPAKSISYGFDVQEPLVVEGVSTTRLSEQAARKLSGAATIQGGTIEPVHPGRLKDVKDLIEIGAGYAVEKNVPIQGSVELFAKSATTKYPSLLEESPIVNIIATEGRLPTSSELATLGTATFDEPALLFSSRASDDAVKTLSEEYPAFFASSAGGSSSASYSFFGGSGASSSKASSSLPVRTSASQETSRSLTSDSLASEFTTEQSSTYNSGYNTKKSGGGSSKASALGVTINDDVFGYGSTAKKSTFSGKNSGSAIQSSLYPSSTKAGSSSKTSALAAVASSLDTGEQYTLSPSAKPSSNNPFGYPFGNEQVGKSAKNSESLGGSNNSTYGYAGTGSSEKQSIGADFGSSYNVTSAKNQRTTATEETSFFNFESSDDVLFKEDNVGAVGKSWLIVNPIQTPEQMLKEIALTKKTTQKKSKKSDSSSLFGNMGISSSFF
jgi:hypothetical protein